MRTQAELVVAQQGDRCIKGVLGGGRPAGWFPASCVRPRTSSETMLVCSVVTLQQDVGDQVATGAAEHGMSPQPEDIREGLPCECVRDWSVAIETDSGDSFRSIRVGQRLEVYATLAELQAAQRNHRCVKGLPTDGSCPGGWFSASCVRVLAESTL